MRALVTCDFGREYLAELADGTQLACTRKGKKQDVACGDQVEVSMSSPGHARIDEIH